MLKIRPLNTTSTTLYSCRIQVRIFTTEDSGLRCKELGLEPSELRAL